MGAVTNRKAVKYTSDLLYRDPGTQEGTKNPSMVIFRLAPQDYHRFHYAVSGIVLDHYSVNGLLYSANPAAINGDDYKVFQENQRSVTVIQTDNDKLVYAIPVGAAMVGSIVFENDD